MLASVCKSFMLDDIRTKEFEMSSDDIDMPGKSQLIATYGYLWLMYTTERMQVLST